MAANALMITEAVKTMTNSEEVKRLYRLKQAQDENHKKKVHRDN